MMRYQWLSLLLITIPAAAQITYNATTDQVIRPLPPPPPMGPAGTVVSDPIYGSPILRVTDGNAYPSYAGEGCVTPAASMSNTFNSDSTRFYVYCHGMVVFPYDFDGASMRATRIPGGSAGSGGLYLDLRGPAFSFHDPDLIYGAGADIKHSSSIIYEYNFATDTYTPLLDLRTILPGYKGGTGSSSVSVNDMLVFDADGIQDSRHFVVHFNIKTKAYKVLDTRAGTLDGRPVTFDGQPVPFGLHLVNLDKSGRFVVISKGERQISPNLLIWDTLNDTFRHVAPCAAGHYSIGYGKMNNACGAIYAQWLVRPLDNPAAYEKVLPDLPGPAYGKREDHSSWNNARADEYSPIFTCLTKWASETSQGPWDDEILGIGTDPANPVVYRFGHSFAYYDGGDFWDVPRGNISQDGRYFLFTSNWGRTLETWRDVFLIRLERNATPTRLSLRSSPDPALEGEAVTFTATISPAGAQGTVQFVSDGQAMGAAALVGGTASFTTSSLSASAHSIAASYAGNDEYLGSTSAVLTQTVVPPQPTTVTLGVSQNPSMAGAAVVFTAQVSPSGATGSVRLLDGVSVIATATLAGGAAGFDVSSLAVGTHSITAVYEGSPAYLPGTSACLFQTVRPAKAVTTTAVTSTANPSLEGNNIMLTARVTPDTATGQVQFRDGQAVLGTLPLSGGAATLWISTLTLGTHRITASYSGDNAHLASESPVLTHIVDYNPGLAVNGGFENATQGWPALRSMGVTRDATVAHSGAWSARFDPIASYGPTIMQPFRVYSGVAYTLSAWVRTENATSVAMIVFLDSQYRELTRVVLPAVSGTQAWQYISRRDIGPRGVYWARVILGAAKARAGGHVWFDDVSFTKK